MAREAGQPARGKKRWKRERERETDVKRMKG
jgi:hypothetical protein